MKYIIKDEIKKLRIDVLGWTQDQLGAFFGVSAAAVNLWEKGKREAPYKVIEYLLNIQFDTEAVECPACDGTGIRTKIKLKSED